MPCSKIDEVIWMIETGETDYVSLLKLEEGAITQM